MTSWPPPPLLLEIRGTLRRLDLGAASLDSMSEGGDRLLFFSGGSALSSLSRSLGAHTRRSTHLITPFDSGGSSHELREAFRMPSIGDLRSRMLSLAEPKREGAVELQRFFRHRLPLDSSARELAISLEKFASGEQPLVAALPSPIRETCLQYLSEFRSQSPVDFDLRGANLGNLALAGAYLGRGRDLDRALRDFEELLQVRGTVRPSTSEFAHLAVRLSSGDEVVGQAAFTGKGTGASLTNSSKGFPIREMYLVDSLSSPRRVAVTASNSTLSLIEQAGLICFPMGSLFSSVLCHLLLTRVGSAVVASRAPRVYVPNLGFDPEQQGMKLSDVVTAMVQLVGKDRAQTGPSDVLDLILLDSDRGRYEMEMDVSVVRGWGVRVLELPIARSSREMDPDRLATVLLSLSREPIHAS